MLLIIKRKLFGPKLTVIVFWSKQTYENQAFGNTIDLEGQAL
jgi:hypothetical protein